MPTKTYTTHIPQAILVLLLPCPFSQKSLSYTQTLVDKISLTLQFRSYQQARIQQPSVHPNAHCHKLVHLARICFMKASRYFTLKMPTSGKNTQANETDRDRHKNTSTCELSLFQSATNTAPNVKRTLHKFGRAVKHGVPNRHFSKLVEISACSTREEEEGRENRQFPSEETLIRL